MTDTDAAVRLVVARLQELVGQQVRRGGQLPERVGADGVVVVDDGDPGEPEVTLSPLTRHYRHVVRVTAAVHGETDDSWERLDELRERVLVIDGASYPGDGLDWVEALPREVEEVPTELGEAVRTARLDLVLHYRVTGGSGGE